METPRGMIDSAHFMYGNVNNIEQLVLKYTCTVFNGAHIILLNHDSASRETGPTHPWIMHSVEIVLLPEQLHR